MMQKTFTRFLLLFCWICCVQLHAQPYPRSSYELDPADSTRLLRWLGNEETIDFSADPVLNSIRSLAKAALPATVHSLTLPARFGWDNTYYHIPAALQDHKSLTHLAWADATDEDIHPTLGRHYLRCDKVGVEFGGVEINILPNLKSFYLPRQMQLAVDEHGVPTVFPLFGFSFPIACQLQLSANHELYAMQDSILFTKDKQTLIRVFAQDAAKRACQIPETVTALSHRAFYGTNFERLTFPNGLRRIPRECCAGMPNLTQVTLGNGVRVLEASAFRTCQQLSNVVLPEQIDTIQDFAFEGCPLTAEFQLPFKITYVGAAAFAGSNIEAFTFEEEDEDLVNTPYTAVEGVLYHEASGTLVAYPSGRKDSDFLVPQFVKKIGRGAISSKATELYLHFQEGLEEIGALAFSRVNMPVVDFPRSLKRVGAGIFSASPWKKITIRESFTFEDAQNNYIERFMGVQKNEARRVDCYVEDPFPCSWDARLVATDTLYVPEASLEAYRLDGEWGKFGTILALEELPEQEPQPYILSHNQETLLKWTGSEEEIDFADYPGLSQVVNLGRDAFRENSNITSLTAPNVTTLESTKYAADEECVGAFGHCENLVNVSLPALKNVGDRSFYNCDALTSVDLPQAEVVGKYTFADCGAVTEVRLPQVQRILANAFSDNESLERLFLGDKLTKIDESAFAECLSLAEIHLAALKAPRASESAFSGVEPSEVKLYVPTKAVKAYRRAAVWQDFLIEGDELTAISLVGNTTSAPQPVFDLSGRRSSSALRGLQILSNGSKRFAPLR